MFLTQFYNLQRLQAKIIKLVDVSYGGENGFNQAIELAAESLQNVKFIQEKKLIGRYFDEISQVTFELIFIRCIFHFNSFVGYW
jgi:peptide chain release factor subunit 1